MSCEQEDPNKKWNERTTILISQKNKFLKNPGEFLVSVLSEFSYDLDAFPSDSELETAFLKTVLRFTSTMRPEEIAILKERLEKVWEEKKTEVLSKPYSETNAFGFQSAINCLKVCQEARKVSCFKMVPDL